MAKRSLVSRHGSTGSLVDARKASKGCHAMKATKNHPELLANRIGSLSDHVEIVPPSSRPVTQRTEAVSSKIPPTRSIREVARMDNFW